MIPSSRIDQPYPNGQASFAVFSWSALLLAYVAVDTQTLETYEAHAVDIAARFRAISPDRLYRTILGFFYASEPTADIGCGSGRDVAWLTNQGFRTTGFEASNAMLREARNHFRAMDLRSDSLPNLATIPDGAYTNVLCSAVLMHLQRADLITAIFSIARILRPAGRAIITYRGSQSDKEREPDGRLFTSIPVGKLTLLLEAAGLKVITSNSNDDPNTTATVSLAASGSAGTSARHQGFRPREAATADT